MGGREQGPSKGKTGGDRRGGSASRGGKQGSSFKRGGSKGGDKKRTFSKAGGKDSDDKRGGKKDFKKREFKANNKRIEKDDSNAHQGLQIVRAETPEKYKKINYGSKGGAEGGLNRRQKQKVSDLIKKLRVSICYFMS
jgi:hypothetical protein